MTKKSKRSTKSREQWIEWKPSGDKDIDDVMQTIKSAASKAFGIAEKDISLHIVRGTHGKKRKRDRRQVR